MQPVASVRFSAQISNADEGASCVGVFDCCGDLGGMGLSRARQPDEVQAAQEMAGDFGVRRVLLRDGEEHRNGLPTFGELALLGASLIIWLLMHSMNKPPA
jgi:hypothetical protein